MNIFKLTIAIPTFNRPNELTRLVSQLRKFLDNKDLNLIIYDNDSNDFPDLGISAYENVKIVKRKFNIGPIANILRIFEECESEWLMIIGDDDEVCDNFYEVVMEAIGNYDYDKDFIAIKFRSELNPYQQEKIINNIEEYFYYNSTPEQFGATALISTWLYRVSSLKRFIRHAYLNAGLQIPHIIPVMEAVKNDKKKVIYLKANPVKWNTGSPSSTWSFGRTYSLMLMNFLIYPLAGEDNNMKYILNGVIGSSIKNLLGFLFKLNYAIPKKNFDNVLMIILIQSPKYFISTLVFLSLRPLLRIKYIKSKIKHKLGNDDTSRM